MEYYLEFGGGLGDIFYQMFHNNKYAILNTLDENNSALVITVTHNPFIFELFYNHPKFKYFRYMPYPYWDVHVNIEHRKKYGLPLQVPVYEKCKADMQIFPYPSDLEGINTVDENTIGISLSAGMIERNIPNILADTMIAEILNNTNKKIVLFGRTFSRNDRKEIQIDLTKYGDRVVSLIDKLTIPGTMSALYKCEKLITCHSSLCILNWIYNKPTFLLYPKETYDRHVIHKDQWVFGLNLNKTEHALFENFDKNNFIQFINRNYND